MRLGASVLAADKMLSFDKCPSQKCLSAAVGLQAKYFSFLRSHVNSVYLLKMRPILRELVSSCSTLSRQVYQKKKKSAKKKMLLYFFKFFFYLWKHASELYWLTDVVVFFYCCRTTTYSSLNLRVLISFLPSGYIWASSCSQRILLNLMIREENPPPPPSLLPPPLNARCSSHLAKKLQDFFFFLFCVLITPVAAFKIKKTRLNHNGISFSRR